MNAERKKVLEMLACGKITAEEAEKLLDKLSAGTADSSAPSRDTVRGDSESTGKNPRFLRIVVDKPGEDQVNVRLPLSFINRGTSLLGVLPLSVGRKLAEHGIDISAFTGMKGEDLVEALQETFVDVGKGNGKKVRIFCE